MFGIQSGQIIADVPINEICVACGSIFFTTGTCWNPKPGILRSSAVRSEHGANHGGSQINGMLRFVKRSWLVGRCSNLRFLGTVDGSEIPKQPPGMYKTLKIMG